MSDLHEHVMETIGVPIDLARHASPDVHEFGDALLAPQDSDVASISAGTSATAFAGFSPAVARADHVHGFTPAPPATADPTLPRGIITKPYYKLTANSGVSTGPEVVVGSGVVNCTLDSTRLYKLEIMGNAISSVAGDMGIIRVRLTNISGAIFIQANNYIPQAGIGVPIRASALVQGYGGAQSFVLTINRYSGTGNFGLSAAGAYPFYMWIEDIGMP